MTQIASEDEARLTYLQRELLKSCVGSKFFNQRTCEYAPPTRRIPKRIKNLVVEIQKLEKKLQKERDGAIRVRVVSIDPDAGTIRIGVLSNLARPEVMIPVTHGQLHFLIHKFKDIEKHFFAEESDAKVTS